MWLLEWLLSKKKVPQNSVPLFDGTPQKAESRKFVDGSLRALNYKEIYNPASVTELTAKTLRAFSTELSILRIILETKKDLIISQEWQISSRAGGKNTRKVKEVTEFLEFPDKINSFSSWLRVLLEDIFVLDAACIFIRKNRINSPYSFDIIDGATILPLMDQYFRTPLPPDIAYQQVVEGRVIDQYTIANFQYGVSNPRSHTKYGFSVVKQLHAIIQLALKRNASLMNYYTLGTVPDCIVTAPDDYSLDELQKLEDTFNQLMAGREGREHGVKMLPSGSSIIQLKDKILSDEFDEWLARLICAGFNMPCSPYIRQVNRATAESAEEVSIRGGLKPTLNFLCDFINNLIKKAFNYPDIVFSWVATHEADALVQAKIDEIYLNKSVNSVNEVRERLGLSIDKDLESSVAEDEDPIKN